MEFDIDKLADDIYKQILYVIHNQRQSSDETITDLYTYAGVFNDLTGIELNTNLFMQQEKINKYLIKYYQTSINDLLNFVNDNMVYLERLATNIFRLLDRNTAIYVYNSYYKYVNRTPDINYNDFKDIIYSFYSRYGNVIFSIVKKMFDELNEGLYTLDDFYYIRQGLLSEGRTVVNYVNHIVSRARSREDIKNNGN